MAYVTLIVPEEVLNQPTRGTIQYHPSLLPRHRGPSSINWPIIMGETRTGLTIFWPDNGLDTGPVLLQKEVEIRDSDTLGSLYFDRLYPMGVAALIEAVDLVRAGTAPQSRPGRVPGDVRRAGARRSTSRSIGRSPSRRSGTSSAAPILSRGRGPRTRERPCSCSMPRSLSVPLPVGQGK